MGRVDTTSSNGAPHRSSYTAVATHVSVPPSDDNDAVIIPDAYLYNGNNDLNRTALRMVASEYADIPETQGLVWHDEFFDDDDDVVAAFDFNYDLMESYYSSIGWCFFGLSFFYTPLFMAALAGMTPCYLRRNVQWSVRSQHVAVTRDGIRFVRDKRRTCWGWSCTDAGKSSKTVPFDKITDCDLEEPAGNSCLVIPNVLVTINIDTASSGGNGGVRHELQISGLKDAKRFKQLVWAMKRRYQPSPPTAVAGNNDDVAFLLREIRDELRQNNNLLVSLKTNTGAAQQQPSAPMEEEEAQSLT